MLHYVQGNNDRGKRGLPIKNNGGQEKVHINFSVLNKNK